MTRRRIAVLLAAMVVLSGVLPLFVLAGVGLKIVSARGERASQEALQAIAEQAAARIESYVAQQRQMLRALAMALTASAVASVVASKMGAGATTSTTSECSEMARSIVSDTTAPSFTTASFSMVSNPSSDAATR